jgi:hypothetical protein
MQGKRANLAHEDDSTAAQELCWRNHTLFVMD